MKILYCLLLLLLLLLLLFFFFYLLLLLLLLLTSDCYCASDAGSTSESLQLVINCNIFIFIHRKR